MKKCVILCALISSTMTGLAQGPDERIILNFTVNGKAARLALDTGADAPVIYRKAAERLGLRITNAPADLKPASGHLILPLTESVDLGTLKAQFGVYDQAPGSPATGFVTGDGLVPLRIMQGQVFTINAEALDVGESALMEPPPDFKGWTKLALATNTPFLELEAGGPGRILIDTGFPLGVAISRKKFGEWMSAHPGSPRTIEAGRFPTIGPFIAQEAWADEISFGNLVIEQVPILEADVERLHVGSIQAIFGIVALKRILLCVDASKGCVYVLQKYGPPRKFRHNRLGAVFLDQIATVMEGTPAYEAGTRTGDRLLSVDLKEAENAPESEAMFRTNYPFWMRPVGTKLRLGLSRDGKRWTTDLALRDIIGPH